MSRELKALVLDDDEQRVRQVLNVMPDYVDAMAAKFSKEAQKLIARDDGTTTDILIMYADDPRAISLYLFDWMKKDSDHLGLRRIPVIVYTDDEFSDRIMEFLEIDDVFIHEGEIDDRNFFSVLSEAIESISSYEDDFYDASLPDGGQGRQEVYEEKTDDIDEVISKLVKNNPERIMGLILNAPSGENNEQRSMLITEEDKIKSVIESVKTSKEKTYQLRLILQETTEDKLSREQITKNYYSQELSEKDSDSVVQQSIERTEVPIIKDGRYDTQLPQRDSTKTGKFISKKGFGSGVSLARVFSQETKQQQAEQAVQKAKKKMLVIDTDIRTKLSMHYYYADAVDVDFANSSMQAIDYFIQNKPDIVLIEYDMPYVNGIMILDSIRRQPNGAKVKAVILLDVSKHGDLITTIATRPGVDGIIYKPFVKEQFIGTMQRCMQ